MRCWPRISLLVALVGLLSACDDMGEGTQTQLPEPRLVDYENFGDPFVRNWCRGCHSAQLAAGERGGAPPGVDFDTHEGVLAWLDRIEARATGDDPTMPPTTGPTDEERELLGQWLSEGAP